MSYLSLKFALFLAAFLIVYYLVPKTGMKQGVILVGNLVFCWGAGVSALAIVLGTTFVSYGAAILIERKYADYERVKADLPLKARVETFNGYKKRCRGYRPVSGMAGHWVCELRIWKIGDRPNRHILLHVYAGGVRPGCVLGQGEGTAQLFEVPDVPRTER